MIPMVEMLYKIIVDADNNIKQLQSIISSEGNMETYTDTNTRCETNKKAAEKYLAMIKRNK